MIKAIYTNDRGWEVYASLPDGWARVQGPTTTPRGCVMITNRQPRWKNCKPNPDRKVALLRVYPAGEHGGEG